MSAARNGNGSQWRDENSGLGFAGRSPDAEEPKQGTVRVLLIEDDPVAAIRVQQVLGTQNGAGLQLVHVELLSDAVHLLLQKKEDVILLDLSLPDSEGLDALLELQTTAPNVAVVVLAAREDDGLVFRALQLGAQDFLIKGQFAAGEAHRALRKAIERQCARTHLQTLLLTDDLTGLPNRRAFLTLAEQQLKMCRRTGGRLLLAFIDVDGLKQINDTFGHVEGDHALLDAAHVLRESFRRSDILARLGGDEFVAVGIDVADRSTEVLPHRIRERLAVLNTRPGRQYSLSLSVGVSLYGAERDGSIEEFLAGADRKIYIEKRGKRRDQDAAAPGSGLPRT